MTEGDFESLGNERVRSTGLPTRLLQYGVAVLSVALALGITLLLGSYLEPTPTPLFFMAVMVSAWYGGVKPGIVATVLSTIAINYFLLEPVYTFGAPNPGTVVRLGVFVMAALLINSLNESQRAARRRAEANFKSLRESEARFGCLAESNIIGMIVAELDGVILEANHNFLELVGYSQEELRAGRLHWRQMTPPESMESSERAVQELLATGVCTPFEKQYIRKDGSCVPVLHGAVVTGRATVTGFVLDLSERKRVEAVEQDAMRRERSLLAEVQAANTQLETVLASLNDQFLVLDQEWRYVYVSDRVVEIVGKSRDELLNKCIWELFPDTVGTQFYTEVHRAATEQQIARFEYFYPAWQRWFENRVYPFADGVSVLVTDITDRKQAEEKLQRTNQTLQTLLDACPVTITFFDPQGIVRVWNRAAERIFGWSAEEAIGQFMPTVPHRRQEFLSSIQTVLSGRSLNGFEVQHQRKDGCMIDLEIWANLAHDAEGNPGCLSIAWDITDRKQAEAEREQLLAREKAAREEAETANRIKDEFLAVLSHELRSPLNPILGWSRLLQTQTLDDQRKQQALATIERNARLQTQLIEDLLDVSRILRGKLVLNVAPVNLISTIEAAFETVRLAVDAKAIDLRFEVNVGVDSPTSSQLNENSFTSSVPHSPIQVMGDATRLQQVVWNLLSNAIKFTPSGGKVEVKLESDERSVTSSELAASTQPSTRFIKIQVKDTGKGISTDFLPYVFDYFRQEDGTTTRKFGGLGLGLAIVRHLTELHGGSVWAESPGEDLGATFTVRLPLLLNSVNVAQTDEIPTVASLSGLKVLAVDDESDIRTLIEFILQQAGAEARVVASATEALQQLEAFSPDILISDIGMPGFDGYMLMRQIRNLQMGRGAIPAIALTAYAGEIDQQQAIAAGFQIHLPKPVEPEKLISVITSLLQEKRMNGC
jgi:PAS domain S-box-containing protein